MISVIIVTKDRPADLKSCAESLLRQSTPIDELIIVDASTGEKKIKELMQDTLAVSPISLKYVHTTPPGIPHQRNVGISLLDSRTDHVCFFDDDVVLSDDAIGSFMQKFDEYKDVVAVQGVEVNRRPQNRLGKLVRTFFLIAHEAKNSKILLSGENTTVIKPDKDITVVSLMVGFCVKKHILDEFKFDEWFTGYAYLEDYDFSYRVCAKYKALQSPAVRLVHNKSSVARSSSFVVSRMYIVNKTYIFEKFFSRSFVRRLFFAWSLAGHLFFSLGKSFQKKDAGYFLGTIEGIAKIFSFKKE